MRISLAMTTDSVGGVWRNVVHLAAGLRERGHTVRIGLRPDAVRPLQEARALSLEVCTLRASIGGDTDVWHVHLHDTFDPYAAALLGARRVLGATVATEHLPHFNGSDRHLLDEGRRTAMTAPVKTVLKRASIATCDAVIIPSERVSRFFTDRYHLRRAGKVHVIPLGLPPQRDCSPIPAEEIGAVLASGSFGIQKGFDLLAQAVKLAAVDWPLTILGEGPHRNRLEQQLDGLIDTRVTLPGWQNDPLTWLDRARVVCLPSRWETFPFAAIEAQLAARPVVAFAVDGIPERLQMTKVVAATAAIVKH